MPVAESAVRDRIELVDPSTARPFRDVDLADADEVDSAVARAVAAQRGWAALAPAERAAALRAFAAVVDLHVDELAALEVQNSGHPIGSATWEAGHVRDVLTYYSGAPERLIGHRYPSRAASTSRSTSPSG